MYILVIEEKLIAGKTKLALSYSEPSLSYETAMKQYYIVDAVLLASDPEKKMEVKKFLQSKAVISLLYVIVMFFLTDLIPDHQDTLEDIATEFEVPGLPLLHKTIFSGGNVSGANLALYESGVC